LSVDDLNVRLGEEDVGWEVEVEVMTVVISQQKKPRTRAPMTRQYHEIIVIKAQLGHGVNNSG
jgi:hypothetical protein